MFCCRELLFSKLFYRHQQQQPPLPVLRAAAGNRSFFSRISDDTLGSFFVWFWTLLVLQSHGVLLPGAAFFEAVLPASAAAAAATSSASSRRQQNLSTNAVFLVDFFCRQSVDKCCFLLFFCCFSTTTIFFPEISRRHVREFFRVLLDLARPSQPWCFAAGSYFFRSCFTGISSSSRRHQFCEQPQATESLDNLSTMCKTADTFLSGCLLYFVPIDRCTLDQMSNVRFLSLPLDDTRNTSKSDQDET